MLICERASNPRGVRLKGSVVTLIAVFLSASNPRGVRLKVTVWVFYRCLLEASNPRGVRLKECDNRML